MTRIIITDLNISWQLALLIEETIVKRRKPTIIHKYVIILIKPSSKSHVKFDLTNLKGDRQIEYRCIST